MDSTVIQEMNNRCANQSTQTISQTMEQPAHCAPLGADMLKNCNSLTGERYTTCANTAYMMTAMVGNVQSAEQTADMGCTVDSTMSALETQESNIDVSALLDLASESKGLMADASVKSDICNNIDSDVNSCTYQQTNNCCTNQASQQIDQVMNMCSGSGNNQIATQDATLNCMIGSDIGLEKHQKTEAKVATEVTAEAVATGFGLPLVAIVVAFMAYKYFTRKGKTNRIYPEPT